MLLLLLLLLQQTHTRQSAVNVDLMPNGNLLHYFLLNCYQ
jgi:hypothetical protein